MPTNKKAIPDWVDEWVTTPADQNPFHGFFLGSHEKSCSVEDIELTHGEYIALKKTLAVSRGYIKAEPAEAVPAHAPPVADSVPKPGNAPVPYQGDLLREHLKDSDIPALLQYIKQRCKGIEFLHKLQDVTRFVEAVENYDNTEAPAETFIVDLLEAHYETGLTPSMARVMVKDSHFVSNFRCMANIADRVSGFYSKEQIKEELDVRGRGAK
jgi:hypothetical protein